MFFFFLLFSLLFSSCSIHQPAHDSDPQLTANARTADSLRHVAKSAREHARFSQALLAADSAITFAQQSGDTVLLVQCMNELATNMRRVSRFERAVRLHADALNLAELSVDTTFQSRKNIAVSSNGLGNAFLSIGALPEANDAFRRALDMETELGSMLGQAINYANLGSIFEMQNQLDSALAYYEKSMYCNHLIGSDMGVGLCHVYFGGIYLKLGQTDRALDEYRQAERLFQSNEDLWHAIEPSVAIAELYLEQRRPSAAAPYVKQVQLVADSLGSPEHLSIACRLASDLHAQQGHTALALAEFRQAAALTDSLESVAHDGSIRDVILRIEHRAYEAMLERERQEAAERQHLYSTITVLTVVISLLLLLQMAFLLYNSRTRIRILLRDLYRQRHRAEQAEQEKGISSVDRKLLEAARTYVYEHIEEGNIQPEQLAAALSVSSSSLNRRLRLLTGLSPKRYILKLRIEYAVEQLRTSTMSVQEVAFLCGFADLSYFSRLVKQFTGMTPSQHKGK